MYAVGFPCFFGNGGVLYFHRGTCGQFVAYYIATCQAGLHVNGSLAGQTGPGFSTYVCGYFYGFFDALEQLLWCVGYRALYNFFASTQRLFRLRGRLVWKGGVGPHRGWGVPNELEPLMVTPVSISSSIATFIATSLGTVIVGSSDVSVSSMSATSKFVLASFAGYLPSAMV